MVFLLPKLKCDLNFGLPVLGVMGIIYSIWACNYLIIVIRLSTRYSNMRDDYLLGPAQHTYLLICFVASILLYKGFQNNDKSLIKFWFIQKWFEFSFVVIGSILIMFGGRSLVWNWPYLILGATILGLGFYLSNTVKEGYKELGIEFDCLRIPDMLRRQNNQEEIPPPSYEEVQTKDNNSTLRI